MIRYALYLATVSAIRFNPVVKKYYSHKKSNGLNGNKLKISCYNKFLNIKYSVIKNHISYGNPKIVSRIIDTILEIKSSIDLMFGNCP